MSVGADDTPSISDPLDPLVSCLCVTRKRVAMLRRAVHCFLDQTYSPRELVVLYESDDVETRDYLASLNEVQILAIEVPVEPKLRLGALRNISVAASHGHYIANWDDDDWHSPQRLTAQIDAMRVSGKPSCLLMRWVIYDLATQQAYLSGQRLWEGSLVAERAAIIEYPNLAMGEDKPVVDQLILEDKVAGLDSPNLYVYVVHGANTWDVAHWRENLLPYAERLTDESAEKVRALLMQHQ